MANPTGNGSGKKSDSTGIGKVYHNNVKDPRTLRQRLKATLKRINIDIEFEKSKKHQPAQAILLDISSQGVGFFAPFSIERGEVVMLHFKEPKEITIRAVVRWCQLTPTLVHIPTRTSGDVYRMGGMFVLKEDADKKAVNDFVKALKDGSAIENYQMTTAANKIAQAAPAVDVTTTPPVVDAAAAAAATPAPPEAATPPPAAATPEPEKTTEETPAKPEDGSDKKAA